MNKSETITKIAEALCAAQKDYPNIPRTKEVIVKTDKATYKFYYAPFDHIVSTMRPILAAHGLAFSQCVIGDALTTTLMHVSGEFISDSMPLRPGTTAQSYGSELTYKRRYSLASVLGLATEDDDDGKGADEQQAGKKSTRVTAEAFTELPVASQITLTKEAKAIEADFYTKSIDDAFKRYEGLKKDCSSEEQIALWGLMDSKVRAAIKRHGKQMEAA